MAAPLFVVFHMGHIAGIFLDEERADFTVEMFSQLYGDLPERFGTVKKLVVPSDRPLLMLSNEWCNKWEDAFPGDTTQWM